MKQNLNYKTVFAELRDTYNQTHSTRMTQEMLGKKLGNINKSTVSRIENGIQTPSEAIYKKYSEIFGVTLEYLYDVEYDNKEKEKTLIQSLGITENVVNTLKLIKDVSAPTYNVSAVVKAFLGNELQTLSFFQSVFAYLKSNYNSEQLDCGSTYTEAMLFSNFMEYIKDVVQPQLEIPLKRAFKEYVLALDNPPNEENEPTL